jgi:hypothetical protein
VFKAEADILGDREVAWPVILDGLRKRVFCPDRYRLSLHLPETVLGLCDVRA